MMATKWGIVSAGKISHDFVTAVRSIPGDDHQIVAVAARNIEDAEKFGKLHNIPKCYSSYEELAKDSNVEVVYVGTITSYHYAASKLMLDHGKHLLVEKSLTTNLHDSKQLMALAKEKKLFLMEAVWSRFLPSYEHMMKEIRSGNIGDVISANVTFGLTIADVERVKLKELGGGTVLDIGIYCLNAICMVFGGARPEKIVAVGHTNESGVDEGLSVSLKYGGNGLATMMTSTHAELSNQFDVAGTKGRITLATPMWCTGQVTRGTESWDFPYPPTILPCNFTNSSGLRYEAMEVRKCIKAGLLESSIMSHADSELLAWLMEEICKQVGVSYPRAAA